ncbi:MAG TPA: ABC transporter substrate-binding protein [Syntrophorhabdales bacterium]|nr:ABC transporter substrate-binding protein [Syntrophorhabdales bacterium]
MAHAKTRGVVIGCLLSVCVLVIGSNVIAAEPSPIKVGLLLPYTGSMPLQAKGINDGVELYFAEIGQKAGGRPIQVIKEDDEVSPTVGLTKARRLVEQYKVNFIVGPVSSAVALAIHDYIGNQKVVLINPCANTRELTAPEKAKENVFRVIETTDQANYPMGKWVYKNTSYRNMVITASDFAAGHHTVEAFKAGFEEAGGKVGKEVFPKLGTMDFAPYMPAMDIKGADAVYTWYAGTDAVRFVQQYQEFGLKKRIPLLGFATLVDDPYLATIGDAALGIVSVSHYGFTIDTPQNRAFVKAYSAKYGEPPSRYSEFGYVAAQMIGSAADALKGEVEDSSKVAKEIRRVAGKIETPSGPLAFDQYNQRISNLYVLKVEKRDGKLVNVVIDRIGRVSQEDTWKWWRK